MRSTGSRERQQGTSATEVDERQVRAVLEMVPVFVGVAVAAHEAAHVPLTLPQYRALFAVDRWGPCSAGGLAERLRVHTSSVTRVSDRLVRAGYLTRETNPDNRREVVLGITDEGRRHVTAVLDVRAAEVRRILLALPAGARADLARIAPIVAEADQRSRQHDLDAWVG